MWLSMRLLAVLDSQGIVAKYSAAIFFRKVDYISIRGFSSASHRAEKDW